MGSGRIWIRGGRVLDPSTGRDEIADVLVEDGKIAAVGAGLAGSGGEVVEAAGAWVVPGFIDLHVHLREPGQEYKEDIASGGRAAVAGGFSAVVCMANTHPVNDDPAMTDFILDRARQESPARVYPVGAATRGLAGEVMTEMVALVDAGCVALSDDGRTIMDSGVMRRVLEYSQLARVASITHAEDRTLVREGVVVIDVGVSRLADGKLCGDVDYDGVAQKASQITPVPGGVGPMTITMLLHNTLEAARRAAAAAASSTRNV